MCDAAAVNIDDAYGERLAAEVRHICPVTTFSTVSDAADFTAKDIRPAPDSSRFMIGRQGRDRTCAPADPRGIFRLRTQ